MFNLIVLLDISEGEPGMLVPVFSSQNTNMPYVQQMDEFLITKEIVPFLEYENYQVIPYTDVPRSIAPHDTGIIAFRSSDGAIICGDYQEVLHYISKNEELISKHQLLRLQLQRIESAELNPSYEMWRGVASQIFSNVDQGKFWVDSELQLFQKQKRIWAEIDPIDADDERSGGGLSYAALTEYSAEYLLRWLANRANFLSKNWTKIWHHVHEKLPFDDRTGAIAVSWIYSLDAEDQDFQQSKSVVYALLQGWVALGKDYPDYGEFLSDRLATDPTVLFSFLRPRQFFRQLFDYLAVKGNLDDVLKLVGFSLSELPKESYIVETLSAALNAIFSQTIQHEDNWVPSTRNRDFEQRHLVEAEKLLMRLQQMQHLFG